jgi:hypothetical protein
VTEPVVLAPRICQNRPAFARTDVSMRRATELGASKIDAFSVSLRLGFGTGSG